MPRFTDKGASIAAVSPQTPGNSFKTVEKNDLSYPVLSDHKNVVGKEFGVVVTMPKDMIDAYQKLGHDLVKANDDDSYELPLPASFLIDQKRIIRLTFIDPDHTRRVDPDDVLEVLEKLNPE
jgi:peroxiredoxin